ncbi:DUF3100 domain-containing protein [Erwiniaceae bacterium L1_55_4]|nr:DUF3100 domain-containing protein [Erwiniaceae bacterium L1_55_4]
MAEQSVNAGRINSTRNFLTIFTWAIIILLIAEFIGPVTIPLGKGKVVLLPMVWALLMGAFIGVVSYRLPSAVSMKKKNQVMAALILQPALLFFTAKQGLVVGASVPEVIKSGWAILFQEFGHFFGTVLLAMPVALLLGIKREAIGATFSVGREPSLAIISEKYGMNSPEGRGVLAEYITGTLLGAMFIALVAGFITSLNIFDPRSLAMASGIGSGSMMAAASGAIASQVDKATADSVMVLAAASNMLTSTIGTYFTLFISLPLAVFSYKILEPLIGRNSRAKSEAAGFVTNDDVANHDAQFIDFKEKILTWVVTSAMALAANWVAFGQFNNQAILACVIMTGVAAGGEVLYLVSNRKIPAVCFVSLIGMFLTSPWCPFSEQIIQITSKMNMLAIITPMLTFAGLSIAKDIPAFRKLGWKIVVVSLVANFGTFIGAAMIAEIFH